MYLSGDSRGLECDFDPIITRNLILQYNIHSELEELLQTSINDIVFRMTCDTIIPPKSSTSYRNVLIKKNYDNALNFHRDLDAYRFLKHFIYLTDCDHESGAHIYIKGSANNLPLSMLGFKRSTLTEISSIYSKDEIIQFNGKTGYSFIEDTTGLHSGVLPTKNKRIMICIQYMDRRSSNWYPKQKFNSLIP